MQEAYKTKAGDTAYAQYFGADCTKKLLVIGMMTALDDTDVFSAATVAIANELNPNYGKTEEEIAAEEKAALAEKVNAMKNTLQSILTAGKTCTLPELIEQATEGSVSAQMIKLGLNTLAAELDKGVSLKLTLNSDRTITGFEISLTKDLLATICEMSAEIETDGTTSVKTGFRFETFRFLRSGKRRAQGGFQRGRIRKTVPLSARNRRRQYRRRQYRHDGLRGLKPPEYEPCKR